MRYMVEDNHGNAFPIVGFVNANGEQTEFLADAAAVVVQVAPDDYVGVARDTITVHMVH